MSALTLVIESYTVKKTSTIRHTLMAFSPCLNILLLQLSCISSSGTWYRRSCIMPRSSTPPDLSQDCWLATCHGWLAGCLMARVQQCCNIRSLAADPASTTRLSHRFNKTEVDTAEFQYRHQDQCWLAESGTRAQSTASADVTFLVAMCTRSLCKFIVSHSE